MFAMAMADLNFNKVVSALADATRSQIYSLVAMRHEVSVSEIVKCFGVSQPAVSQHLGKLEDAGLITKRKSGREVLCSPNPDGLVPVLDWVNFYTGFWHAKILSLSTHLNEIHRLKEQNVTKEIVVESELPFGVAEVWGAISDSQNIKGWLMENDFRPVKGASFQFKTKPIGDWDGIVHCQVLELEAPHRLSYSWQGGVDPTGRNPPHLDTVVSWELASIPGGTRLTMRHSGFEEPKDDFAFAALKDGWQKMAEGIAGVIRAQSKTSAPAN
jgi:uncharacterized protein YndB with AHSA1/START domain